MHVQEQEERDYRHSTTTELSQADAAANGAFYPQCKWALSDWDAWHINPHWDGTSPNQPHPEEMDGMTDEEYDALMAA